MNLTYRIALNVIAWAALLTLLCHGQADAAVATFYIQAAGCTNGNTRCSGTTDSTTELVSGAAATITCSATTGPAVTPGCSLSGTPNLSLITGCTAGSCDGSQFIYLDCATNTNQKVFPIITTDDATDLVGTTGTPTGCTAATSDWGVGGRRSWPGGATAEVIIRAGIRAGDTIQFNDTPATKTVTYFTSTNAGDSASGMVNIIGKAGVRPVLELTSGNTSTLVVTSANYFVSNLELKSDGATSSAVLNQGQGGIAYNVKISASNGAPGVLTGAGSSVLNSEITGVGDGISVPSNATIIGNYIHGVTGDGIEVTITTPIVQIINNVINAPSARGIFLSSATTSSASWVVIFGNTIYGAGSSGLESTDADTKVIMYNNIFQENGNAAGEFNVKWAAGSAETVSAHYNNLYFHSNCQGSATGGPACVSGLTVNSTELSSDALFTNAGSSNFTLQSASPAKATGFPGAFLGGNTGYLDMGALQRQEAGGSAGVIRSFGPPGFGP